MRKCWVFVVTAGMMLGASGAWALPFTWSEKDNGGGDTGGKPDTAQVVTAPDGYELTAIEGKLNANTNFQGVDMFAIWIYDPVHFSAATVMLDNGVLDPQLFLFDADGFGVISNDDANSSDPNNFQSALGWFTGEAGLYYLAINHFDNDPLDRLGSPIFFEDDSLNPGAGAFAKWDKFGFDDDGGPNYRIELTGTAPVPEPGTLILLGSGLLGLTGAARRRGRK